MRSWGPGRGNELGGVCEGPALRILRWSLAGGALLAVGALLLLAGRRHSTAVAV